MFEKALILGLYSITPVHAGSGAELSVIDLPIQRERHTGFPIIWGQSLKGVLRRAYEKSAGEEKTNVIFGPPTDKAHEHAGAISVGDAKVLLFPVRSLKGVFAYVTCPLVLERFVDDLVFALEVNERKSTTDVINKLKKAKNAIKSLNDVFSGNSHKEQKAIVFSDDLVIEKDGKKYVILEDVLLEVDGDKGKSEGLKSLLELIENITPENVKSRIDKKAVIVSDEVFTAFVTTTTEIVARIQIDADTGTVKTGALWYEEYLPSDTLLYSVIAVGKPRKAIDGLTTADGAIQELRAFDGRFIQVGGNETVGKGFVKLKVW